MISINGITKRFGDITALDDVSLDVAAGQSLAVIGPAAAGKSVLLKLIAGLYAAESGQIRIDGVTVGTVEQRDEKLNLRIGMLFQQNALFDSLSVWENIAFRLLMTGTPRDEARAVSESLLQKVGLPPETAELFPSDLSGGMQKRVGFARALATGADILLLDNPTAGLDPILAARIDRMITRLARDSGATVISVTGNMVGIDEAYDEIAVLDKGRVKWRGPAGQAQTDPNPWLRQLVDGRRDGPIDVMAAG
ncbi:MAG: ABC transporter ATP-binding protein [Parvibaculales bacterium]